MATSKYIGTHDFTTATVSGVATDSIMSHIIRNVMMSQEVFQYESTMAPGLAYRLVPFYKDPKIFADCLKDNKFIEAFTGSPQYAGDGSYPCGVVWDASGSITSRKMPSLVGTITKGYLLSDYEIHDTYDEFGDASIDTTKWTTAVSGTGAVSETGGYLQLSTGGSTGTGQAEALTRGSGENNLNGKTVIRFLVVATNVVANGTFTLYASDAAVGANEVTLWNTSGLTDYFECKLTWDSNSKFMEVLVRNQYGQLTFYNLVDCTALTTGTMRLRFKASAGASDRMVARLMYLRHKMTSPTTSIVHQLSANGGTNWETVTNEQTYTFTNTGTSTQYKMSFTLSSGEYVFLNGFGYKVN